MRILCLESGYTRCNSAAGIHKIAGIIKILCADTEAAGMVQLMLHNVDKAGGSRGAVPRKAEPITGVAQTKAAATDHLLCSDISG